MQNIRQMYSVMIALLHHMYCMARIGGCCGVSDSGDCLGDCGSCRPCRTCGSCGCAAFKTAIGITHKTVDLLRIALIAIAIHNYAHGIAWLGVWNALSTVLGACWGLQ